MKKLYYSGHHASIFPIMWQANGQFPISVRKTKSYLSLSSFRYHQYVPPLRSPFPRWGKLFPRIITATKEKEYREKFPLKKKWILANSFIHSMCNVDYNSVAKRLPTQNSPFHIMHNDTFTKLFCYSLFLNCLSTLFPKVTLYCLAVNSDQLFSTFKKAEPVPNQALNQEDITCCKNRTISTCHSSWI